MEIVTVTEELRVLPQDLEGDPKAIKRSIEGWISTDVAINRSHYPGPRVRLLDWKIIKTNAKGNPWISVTYEVNVSEAKRQDIHY
jgi:hypothetical protein